MNTMQYNNKNKETKKLAISRIWKFTGIWFQSVLQYVWKRSTYLVEQPWTKYNLE
jgi:hypothetical protein